MQATRVDYPIITAVVQYIADWLKYRSHQDLRYLPPSEVGRIAADVGLTAGELRRLDRQPDQPLLLHRMLKVLGLDEVAIKQHDPLVFRDLERCCAMCDVKTRCRNEFKKGTARLHFEEFCPNSVTLKALA
jgi:hypothetical protein